MCVGVRGVIVRFVFGNKFLQESFNVVQEIRVIFGQEQDACCVRSENMYHAVLHVRFADCLLDSFGKVDEVDFASC